MLERWIGPKREEDLNICLISLLSVRMSRRHWQDTCWCKEPLRWLQFELESRHLVSAFFVKAGGGGGGVEIMAESIKGFKPWSFQRKTKTKWMQNQLHFFSSLWKKPARGSACFVFWGVFFGGGGLWYNCNRAQEKNGFASQVSQVSVKLTEGGWKEERDREVLQGKKSTIMGNHWLLSMYEAG